MDIKLKPPPFFKKNIQMAKLGKRTQVEMDFENML